MRLLSIGIKAAAGIDLGDPENLTIPSIIGFGWDGAQPKIGATMTPDPGSWTSSPTDYEYLWYVEGNPVALWEGPSFAPSDYVDVGGRVRVGVKAEKGAFISEEVFSDWTDVMVCDPHNTVAPTFSNMTFRIGETQTLYAEVGSWISNPAITEYDYIWEFSPDGESSWVDAEVNADSIVLPSGSGGKFVRLGVKASQNGVDFGAYAYSAVSTYPVTAYALPEYNYGGDFSALPRVGLENTVTVGTWSNVGAEYGTIDYTFQWKFDGYADPGCTTNTVTPDVSYLGAVLSCLVTAHNMFGSADYELVCGTILSVPINTTAPVVSTEDGYTYATTNGTWNDNPSIEYFAYVWDIVDVYGSTIVGSVVTDSTTVDLTGYEEYNEDYIRCTVTAFNAIGGTGAYSNIYAINIPVAPSNYVAPVIEPSVGSLTGQAIAVTDPGSWDGGVGSFTYQWQLSSDGETWFNYIGATDDNMVSIGDNFYRCVVTAHNDAGAGDANSNTLAGS